jgi:hypothetical protein
LECVSGSESRKGKKKNEGENSAKRQIFCRTSKAMKSAIKVKYDYFDLKVAFYLILNISTGSKPGSAFLLVAGSGFTKKA